MEQPIFSKRISAGTRVYYIDARVDKGGRKYITLTEIPTSKHPQKNQERQRIFIHSENIDAFAEALAEVAKQLKTS